MVIFINSNILAVIRVGRKIWDVFLFFIYKNDSFIKLLFKNYYLKKKYLSIIYKNEKIKLAPTDFFL